MNHEALVRALWERMEARDWDNLPELFHAEFVLEWQQSNERIRGATNFVKVNQNYPGDWHIRILRIVVSGDEAASQVAVDIDGRTDTASSFYTFENGEILSITEYWSETYNAPDWRRAWTEQLKA